jgi:NADPH:quinone reductase-like Zn-dependent oxidoreductase
MRALAVTERGAPPAVLEVADSEPGPGQVRIAVEAASINGFDVAVANGYVWDHMPHTFPVVIGRDFAGIVDSVGDGVTHLAAGDRVAGVNTALELGVGPVAERINVDAGSVVLIPDNVTSVQAAAVGLAAVTALDLVDALQPAPGEPMLIAGATGGVGAFAVQLASRRGVRVLATARTGAPTDFVRGLGASDVVDYETDLSAAVHALIPGGAVTAVHAAGDPSVVGRAVAPGGRLASVLGATGEQVGRDDVQVIAVMATYTPEKLGALLAQVATGELAVPISGTYPLADAAAALSAFQTGKLGKIVVTVP